MSDLTEQQVEEYFQANPEADAKFKLKLTNTVGSLRGEKSELKTSNDEANIEIIRLNKLLEKTNKPKDKKTGDDENNGDLSEEIQAKITALENTNVNDKATIKSYQKREQQNYISGEVIKSLKAAGLPAEIYGAHVQPRIAAKTDADGKTTLVALGLDGKVMYDASGNPAGVDAVVSDVKTRLDKHMPTKAKSGTGGGFQSKSDGNGSMADAAVSDDPNALANYLNAK